MSATNRGAVRNEADFYPTPAWCVDRLLERCQPEPGNWLEPAIGGGDIVNAVRKWDELNGIIWHGIDINLADRSFAWVERGVDFLKWRAPGHFETIITNPPYSLAAEFVSKSLPIADWVVMLLRLNFLGSAKRRTLFANEMPDIYVLPNRPSFTGKGTDATEYAWFVWGPERRRTSGKIEILAETPAAERRAA